jgi:protein-disulfide isomerase
MAKKNEEKKKGLTVKIPSMNPWMIATAVLVIILGVILVTGWSITGQVVSQDGTSTMSAEDAANNAIDYINIYLLQGQGTATLDSIEEENGFYHIKLDIDGMIYDSYVTLDGNWLFPTSVIDLTETPESPTTTTPQTSEVSKTDKPDIHAFVMSYCPYGLQFMKAYIPVIELLEDKANLELNFVHYIMHGEKEATENTRMYCIQKEQKDKFTDYLRCFVENGDAEKCISDVGINKASLETCMQKIDEEFEITKTMEESQDVYPPYMVDVELSQMYGVRGSPTFVVNGQTVQVNRSPEAIKQAICSAFNNPPDECNQKLSETAEQPSFGPIGSGSGAPSSEQC